MNVLGMWPNLLRAVEIAKAGDFTLKAFPESGYDFDKDYRLIKSSCLGFYERFIGGGMYDLLVEVGKPTFEQFRDVDKYTSLSCVEERIERSKNLVVGDDLDKSSVSLIKMAYEKHVLCVSDLFLIRSVAKVIARLDNSDKIRACDVAEAIQYIPKKETFDFSSQQAKIPNVPSEKRHKH